MGRHKLFSFMILLFMLNLFNIHGSKEDGDGFNTNLLKKDISKIVDDWEEDKIVDDDEEQNANEYVKVDHQEHSLDDNECVICYDEFSNDKPKFAVAINDSASEKQQEDHLKHASQFHQDCIVDWMKRSQDCPKCRQTLVHPPVNSEEKGICQDDRCCICLENFDEEGKFAVLLDHSVDLQHRTDHLMHANQFHEGCVRNHIIRGGVHTNCPLCRQLLDLQLSANQEPYQNALANLNEQQRNDLFAQQHQIADTGCGLVICGVLYMGVSKLKDLFQWIGQKIIAFFSGFVNLMKSMGNWLYVNVPAAFRWMGQMGVAFFSGFVNLMKSIYNWFTVSVPTAVRRAGRFVLDIVFPYIARKFQEALLLIKAFGLKIKALASRAIAYTKEKVSASYEYCKRENFGQYCLQKKLVKCEWGWKKFDQNMKMCTSWEKAKAKMNFKMAMAKLKIQRKVYKWAWTRQVPIEDETFNYNANKHLITKVDRIAQLETNKLNAMNKIGRFYQAKIDAIGPAALQPLIENN